MHCFIHCRDDDDELMCPKCVTKLIKLPMRCDLGARERERERMREGEIEGVIYI